MFEVYGFLVINVLMLVSALVITRRSQTGLQSFSRVVRFVPVYAFVVIVVNMLLLRDTVFFLFGNFLISACVAGLHVIMFGGLQFLFIAGSEH